MNGAERIAAELHLVDCSGALPHELARAAYTYLGNYLYRQDGKVPASWPWSYYEFDPMPNSPVHQLARAGAFIAAEIDRLQREAAGGGHDIPGL